jgi:hypothetical protein
MPAKIFYDTPRMQDVFHDFDAVTMQPTAAFAV